MDDLIKEITDRLMETFSSSTEEKIRQKKKRFEAHFQKWDNISGSAFTIASEESRETVLGAYFLRLNGKHPFKHFPAASEGYCLDSVHAHLLSPILYALCSVYSLNLTHTDVSFHFTSKKAMDRLELLLKKEVKPKDSIEEAVYLLCSLLKKIDIVPCFKGAFFEKMQSKVYMLKRHNVNEQVALEFDVVAKCLLGETAAV